jgi:hypothetical protein
MKNIAPTVPAWLVAATVSAGALAQVIRDKGIRAE